MNAPFYFACVRHLATDESVRVLKNAGINQSDWDQFKGGAIWTPDMRTRMRRVMDQVVFALCDMAALPRTDIPAEMPAAVIAIVVSPSNWMIAASYISGLRPAKGLMEDPEETVQIERVSSGKMLTYIFMADAAMRNDLEYEQIASRIGSQFAAREVLK